MRRAVVSLLLSAVALAACRRGEEREARVVVAFPSRPAAGALEEVAFAVSNQVYEGLLQRDAELALRPQLAASWWTPDELHWAFELRARVRLHDGRLLTAADVARALEAERARNSALAAVVAITAQGAHRVVFETRHPLGSLASRLASVSIKVPGREAGSGPVGTGPYEIEATTAESVRLRAFAGYWGGRPAVSELEFRFLPDASARVAALRRREVDLILDAPAEEIAALAASSGLRTVVSSGLRVLLLGMDVESETLAEVAAPANPFRDPRVRQAVALAVDRAALVDGPLGGYADVVDQAVAPEIHGFAPGLEPIPHDPASARRLLAAAGYGGGFTVPLDYPLGKYRAVEQVAVRIAADLARVGIRAQPRAVPAEQFVGSPSRRALYLSGWMTTGDALQSYELLVHTQERGYGEDNDGGYSDRDVDRWLESAASETAAPDRLRWLERIAERLRRDLPIVPLYRQRDLYAHDAGLVFHPRLDRGVLGVELRWQRVPSAPPSR